ncbi:MAG: PDZ domain-containing protein [Kofleriaceae bacterium]
MRYTAISLLLVAATAVAAPAPTLVNVEVERDQVGGMLTQELPAAETEPGGLLVNAGADPQWFAVGLKVGDVIRYLDGTAAAGRLMLRDGLNVLEVDRGGRVIVVRVLIHGPATATKQLSPSDFEELAASLVQPDPQATIVRRGKTATGVRITEFLLSFRLDLEIGDIVRRIDGSPILSNGELITALQQLKVGTTRFELERHGRPVTLEIIRDAPADLAKIKRVSATRYEIPRALADVLQADLFIARMKLDSELVVTKKLARGVRIHNVQRDAPAAAVGLQNDDIILDVEGRPVSSISEAADAVRAIATATQVTVHIERNGKPLAFTYVIK